MDKMMKYFWFWLMFLPILPVTALSYSFLHLSHSNALVLVNKERVFAEYIRALSQFPLDEMRIAHETSRFQLAFQKTLQTYASTHHVVILDKKNVLAADENEAIDVTDGILHDIQLCLREKS